MTSDRAVASWTIRIVLTVSLALNLFIAGWLVGDWVRPRPPMPPGLPADGQQLDMEGALVRWMAERLSSEGRERLLANWEAVQQDTRISSGEEVARRREAVREMLRGETIDAEAFARSMNDLHAALSERIGRLMTAVVRTAPELSVEDRRLLADLPPLSRVPLPGPWREKVRILLEPR